MEKEKKVEMPSPEAIAQGLAAVSEYIAGERKAAGLSQTTMARRMGMTRQGLAKMESGQSLTITGLIKYAAALEKFLRIDLRNEDAEV